jgi:hypothetical protein
MILSGPTRRLGSRLGRESAQQWHRSRRRSDQAGHWAYALGVPDPAALLQRFQPQLRYDSQEAFFADSAAEWTDNPRNVLRRATKPGDAPSIIAAATPGGTQPQLSLEFLGHPSYANGALSERGDNISDPAGDYRNQYVALRTRGGYANRMYGRALADSHGQLWLQYWFFYFYNDYNLAGNFGLHTRAIGRWSSYASTAISPTSRSMPSTGSPRRSSGATSRSSPTAPTPRSSTSRAGPTRPTSSRDSTRPRPGTTSPTASGRRPRLSSR